jgi:hypothetical protein
MKNVVASSNCKNSSDWARLADGESEIEIAIESATSAGRRSYKSNEYITVVLGQVRYGKKGTYSITNNVFVPCFHFSKEEDLP